MAAPGQTRPYSLVFSLGCLLALFGSCCQMAPAVVDATRGWNVGAGSRYEFVTTILSREAGKPRPGGDVGFQMTGELSVAGVWQDPKDPHSVLLRIELESPQLWIKSRRAPEPEGFVEHSSRLDHLSKKPIFALWKRGEVSSIFLDVNEYPSSANLKRGLVSIFQYRTLDGEYRERDASGSCNVAYTSRGPQILEKRKSHCEAIIKDQHPNSILSVGLESTRSTSYELNSQLLPVNVDEREQHELTLKAKPEIGTTVTSRRILREISSTSGGKSVQAVTVQQAIVQLQPGYKEVGIDLEIEPNTCPDSGCRTLEEIIEENRDALESAALGTAKSASAFLKLIPAVRSASIDELTKWLQFSGNRGIRTQLLDVLGSASTPITHRAAMKVLRQDYAGDDTERYLWALSMSPSPSPEIIKDVLKRSEETMQNDKLSETLALTAAAMARQNGDPSVVEKVRASLEIGLESCSGDDCRLKFLRALRNVRAKASIPILLNYARNSTRSTSVAAWRALAALDTEHLTEEIRKAALRTFYQYSGRRDSSVRTYALDLVLDNRPSVNEIRGVLEYLGRHDPMFEVRRYVGQRIEQLAEKDSAFRSTLEQARKYEDKRLNYDVMAYRGLSTAFERPFLTSTSSNGSLVTVQEVNSGLLKRGVVDVVVKTSDHEQALFSLGLFAGGLGSFVSSSQDEGQDNSEEDETATAGMEISLLGVGVRPFVFFSGQGELMGHVWSGTASERTPAYQAMANLHRHNQLVPLASGFVADLDIEGAMSFDLEGQIRLSLWSRNAQSQVEMAAGIAIRGESRVRSEFVQSTAEFSLTVEPKLELSTDVDFSGPVSLCMRLTQPKTSVRHNVYKIERIPGSRHRLRKTRRSILISPAKSYLLNRKNNEMCSKIFS